MFVTLRRETGVDTEGKGGGLRSRGKGRISEEDRGERSV